MQLTMRKGIRRDGQLADAGFHYEFAAHSGSIRIALGHVR
jgi:hypothetical protein